MLFKRLLRFNQHVLFKFTTATGVVFETSSKRPVTFAGDTYQPAYISHGDTYSALDKNKMSIKVTTDKKHWLVDDAILGIPAGKISLEIVHYSPNSPTPNSLTVFRGFLVSGALSGQKADFKFMNEIAYASRFGNQQNFSVLCQHDLYGPQCRATPINTFANVSAINGNQYTLPGISSNPNGFFTMGKFSGGGALRTIIKHVGDDIWLSAAVPTVNVGDPVLISAGCDKTIGTCQSRFGNNENFGGFKYIPNRDPMNGGGRIA